VSSGNAAWLESLVGTGPADPELPRFTAPDEPVVPAGGDPQVLVLPLPGGGAAPAGAAPLPDTSGYTGSGIPVRVLASYVAAARQTAQLDPDCHIDWSLLAGIGRVETNHGRFGGARVSTDGVVSPAIFGPRLNGTNGFVFIRDHDGGRLDGDPAADRAMGPMQFIPTTWKEAAIDADNNGVTDPNDIDDAALAAANYLCNGGRNLSTSEDWWSAILSYNDVQRYAQDVFTYANDYGARSRT
jgi:membrane-bound lytic murein transglycosylase B